MRTDLASIEAIIRKKICGVCTERTVNGDCGLERPSGCALFRLFPEIAEAVLSVDSTDIRDYIDAIRHNVCSICTDQAEDGSCEARQQVRCALDAYLVLVVDAIEEATGKSFERKGIGQAAGTSVQLGPQMCL